MKALTVMVVSVLVLGLFLLLYPLGVCVFVGCFDSDYSRTEETFTKSDLQMIEERCEIKLPPTAKGLILFYDMKTCIDPSFVAKIQIPAQDIADLKKQINSQQYDTATISGTLLSSKTTWWLDEKKATYSRPVTTRKAALVRYFTDETCEQVFLYIEWILI